MCISALAHTSWLVKETWATCSPAPIQDGLKRTDTSLLLPACTSTCTENVNQYSYTYIPMHIHIHVQCNKNGQALWPNRCEPTYLYSWKIKPVHVQIDGIRVKRISGMYAQSQMYTEQKLRSTHLAVWESWDDKVFGIGTFTGEQNRGVQWISQRNSHLYGPRHTCTSIYACISQVSIHVHVWSEKAGSYAPPRVFAYRNMIKGANPPTKKWEGATINDTFIH